MTPQTHPFKYSFTTCFKERAIVGMLAPSPGRKTLEMGCGSAYFATVLAARFGEELFEYVGIDMSDSAVESASRFLRKKDRVVQGSVTALPFSDNEFDDVLYLDVIEHVDNDRKSLQEAFRVLRPGGRLVISTPNSSAPLTDTFFCEYMHDHGHMDNQRSGYHASELSSLLTESGFRVEETKFTNILLSELMITATKLGYRILKPKYSSQSDVIEVSDSPLFRLHQKVFFPVGYAVGRAEEAILGRWLKGHCMIILARKPG